jgi:hypothetical protein
MHQSEIIVLFLSFIPHLPEVKLDPNIFFYFFLPPCRGEVATLAYQRLQQHALDVEHDTIIRLRNHQVINEDALRRIQRDLDLAEARLTG